MKKRGRDVESIRRGEVESVERANEEDRVVCLCVHLYVPRRAESTQPQYLWSSLLLGHFGERSQSAHTANTNSGM